MKLGSTLNNSVLYEGVHLRLSVGWGSAPNDAGQFSIRLVDKTKVITRDSNIGYNQVLLCWKANSKV